MTDYQIRLMPEATTDLYRLEKPSAQRILNKLKWLSRNFDILTPVMLGGGLKGFYKLRVGSY